MSPLTVKITSARAIQFSFADGRELTLPDLETLSRCAATFDPSATAEGFSAWVAHIYAIADRIVASATEAKIDSHDPRGVAARVTFLHRLTFLEGSGLAVCAAAAQHNGDLDVTLSHWLRKAPASEALRFYGDRPLASWIAAALAIELPQLAPDTESRQ